MFSEVNVAGGIKIVGGHNIQILDCGFDGLDFGIDAEDCSDLIVEGNKFSEVASPVKAKRVNGLKAKNNVEHNVSKSPTELTIVARLVAIYISQLQGRK